MIKKDAAIYSDPSSNVGVRECDCGVLCKIAFYKPLTGKQGYGNADTNGSPPA
jgi:hypothetical protein